MKVYHHQRCYLLVFLCIMAIVFLSACQWAYKPVKAPATYDDHPLPVPKSLWEYPYA